MLARIIDVNKQLAKSQRIFDPSNEYKRKRKTLFPTDIENFGGRGGGGVTTFRFQYPVLPPPASRLLYSFVPLSPDSRPLLCFSRYRVNDAVWLPVLIVSALALSKIKNGVVNRNTSHSPARSLKQHSFDTSLHQAAKSSVFRELQSYGARSPSKVFHGRIFPHHTEKSETRQKWSTFQKRLSMIAVKLKF